MIYKNRILYNQTRIVLSFSSNEWKNRAMNGEVCARIGCSNKPKIQCQTCYIYYCYEHVGGHFHELTEKEKIKQLSEKQKLR
jgi:hypothetical protein